VHAKVIEDSSQPLSRRDIPFHMSKHHNPESSLKIVLLKDNSRKFIHSSLKLPHLKDDSN
jgi:hypothetical protein